MAITRIESLVFGVADVAACQRFYADGGLTPLPASDGCARLGTPEGQTIELRPMDDAALPPAMETGPTLREIVWGVDSAESLAALGAELARDREVRQDADGSLHSHDETGFGIALRLARGEHAAEEPRPRYNALRRIERWNDDPPAAALPPRPARIVHLAMNIPKAGHERAIRFYLERLRFKATDRILDTGTFMQCEGDVEHHNFFLCHRPDIAGLNHFAVELRSFDEVLQAGNRMVDRGWKESRVLGRHLLGSNLYRFFHSPAGGRMEFVTDMDRMDKSFVTRVWDKNPGHHIWSLKSWPQAE